MLLLLLGRGGGGRVLKQHDGDPAFLSLFNVLLNVQIYGLTGLQLVFVPCCCCCCNCSCSCCCGRGLGRRGRRGRRRGCRRGRGRGGRGGCGGRASWSPAASPALLLLFF